MAGYPAKDPGLAEFPPLGQGVADPAALPDLPSGRSGRRPAASVPRRGTATGGTSPSTNPGGDRSAGGAQQGRDRDDAWSNRRNALATKAMAGNRSARSAFLKSLRKFSEWPPGAIGDVVDQRSTQEKTRRGSLTERLSLRHTFPWRHVHAHIKHSHEIVST